MTAEFTIPFLKLQRPEPLKDVNLITGNCQSCKVWGKTYRCRYVGPCRIFDVACETFRQPVTALLSMRMNEFRGSLIDITVRDSHFDQD